MKTHLYQIFSMKTNFEDYTVLFSLYKGFHFCFLKISRKYLFFRRRTIFVTKSLRLLFHYFTQICIITHIILLHWAVFSANVFSGSKKSKTIERHRPGSNEVKNWALSPNRVKGPPSRREGLKPFEFHLTSDRDKSRTRENRPLMLIQ